MFHKHNYNRSAKYIITLKFWIKYFHVQSNVVLAWTDKQICQQIWLNTLLATKDSVLSSCICDYVYGHVLCLC